MKTTDSIPVGPASRIRGRLQDLFVVWLLIAAWLVTLPVAGADPIDHLAAPLPVATEGPPETLRSGWFQRPPYQYADPEGVAGAATGLDLRVAREAAEATGHAVRYDPMPWSEQLLGLKHGTLDLVVGTYFEPERLNYVHYSRPYREERNALYLHEDGERRLANREAFLGAVEAGEFRLGVTRGYAFADPEVARLVRAPGEAARILETDSDAANVAALVEGRIDGFIADPVILDLFLAETGHATDIRRARIDLGSVGVRVMFSRATVPREFVETFDAELKALEDSRRIANLEVEHLLPAFLAMTTSEVWFNVLTLMGILAFSASGVMLARRERYNLFGALVLATLPAIGGGVLRDLLLGRDPIFIFESPEFLLLPLAVVLGGFALYKLHDHWLVHLAPAQRLLARQRAGLGGRMVGNVQHGLDAWAVAAFTVIGVGVAVEAHASPLWLWGPVMAVVTASFGVIMRDVVRSDFNIDMLKRDSFAEIAIVGGIAYSLLLLWPPVELSMFYILMVTNGVILSLFLARLLVLWSGWVNPLQMGDPHTVPERRLDALEAAEPALWQRLSSYLEESETGRARGVDPRRLESLHKDFGYALEPWQTEFTALAGEPLFESTVMRYQNLRARFDTLRALEQQLYDHLRVSISDALPDAEEAGELETRVAEGLRSLLDTVSMAVDSGEREDFEWLQELSRNQRARFDDLRARYLKADPAPGGALDQVLQRTHRVERMMWMLADYVDQRLSPGGVAAVSDRRQRQMMMQTGAH